MPDNKSEISNTALGKIFSAEVLISLALTIAAVAGSYSVLADDQKEQEIEIKQIKSGQADIKNTVHVIKTDVAVIMAEQSHLQTDVTSNKQTLMANQKTLAENQATLESIKQMMIREYSK